MTGSGTVPLILLIAIHSFEVKIGNLFGEQPSVEKTEEKEQPK